MEGSLEDSATELNRHAQVAVIAEAMPSYAGLHTGARRPCERVQVRGSFLSLLPCGDEGMTPPKIHGAGWDAD